MLALSGKFSFRSLHVLQLFRNQTFDGRSLRIYNCLWWISLIQCSFWLPDVKDLLKNEVFENKNFRLM